MADWTDVRRLALALPETTEATGYGRPDWRVRKKVFLWDRPLGKRDRELLGDAAPQGELLGVRVADLGAKESMLVDGPAVCFTIPHFDGYAAVLARLDELSVEELRELVLEGWFAMAPTRLAAQFERDGLS